MSIGGQNEHSYDVAIIGAGIMGASTALFLARGGMSCALIDRRGVCSEASGVNAGTLTMQMTRAALIPYALKAWEMWGQPETWLGSDPGVTLCDGLSLAFSDPEIEILEQRAQARRQYGADIEVISPKRAKQIEPGLSDHPLAAAYCKTDGHVTANRTGLAFRAALKQENVHLFENMQVDAVAQIAGGFSVVSKLQPINARRVVLAGGVWLEEMLGWLGVKVPIKTLINQLAITERMPPAMCTVIGIANGLLSLKQFANGTVLIGGGWQGEGDRETRHTELVPENLIGNAQLACHAIPALMHTRLVRAWSGFEAETEDAMPIVGEVPGVEDAFVIGSAHSGYTSGPYMGKILAQRILGQTPEMSLFDPQRLVVNT
ncbi:MAG: FAD-binding oxidoreductase [Rhodospirillales bacterium]|nr:FAD-binding oxidoreductase [Rhodospirillales bacterium]